MRKENDRSFVRLFVHSAIRQGRFGSAFRMYASYYHRDVNAAVRRSNPYHPTTTARNGVPPESYNRHPKERDDP